MTTPVLADIVALRPIAIRPGRTVAEGEVFARVQFRDEEDRRHFSNNLRWSAFRVVDPEAKPVAPAPKKPAPAKKAKPDKPAAE
ncbi:MAG TPA: hypothetical protein VD838_03495 [Anaeromyxobacteraceae bacterium]|nr:hypothetical protein [Anaeromyxobacteraceae bacterium]